MSLRVLKWSVPVDDQVHEIGAGPLVHVGCQGDPDQVQVWTLETDPTGPAGPARIPVRVHGTGEPLPGDVEEHVGSTIAGPFVWHVFRVHAPGDPR